MTALIAGVQYGLSSHKSFYENKSLIFVKLTDSAHRAIENYVKNQNKIHQNPTIQFLGNEGQLTFPSLKSSYSNFIFSLTSNQDIEGPQGGFECVQQTGPKNLESLGTLPCKMRIQANDDVYETTRHRMHAAEENNKNKCTLVIKANEPVGRKVKVKGNVKNVTSSSQVSSNISIKHRDTLTLSTVNPPAKLPSCKAVYNSNYRLHLETNKKSSDVVKRPLKERLIHLLAIKPFKKCELYDRIKKEGVKDKEKNIMVTLLKQIAFMRENTYYLNRYIWNDVQEDWPYYTEQEKIILKGRKTQNLTPPGSSDGCSSNGQSPISTHPESSPNSAFVSQESISSKRPGYYQGNDGLPTKRQRISHYRKPELSYSLSNDNGKSIVISSTNSNPDQKFQNQERNFTTAKSNGTQIKDCEEANINCQISTKQSSLNNRLLNNKISHITRKNLGSNDQNFFQYEENNQHQEFPITCSKEIDPKEFYNTYLIKSISADSEQNITNSKTSSHTDKSYDLKEKHSSSLIKLNSSLDFCDNEISNHSDIHTNKNIINLTKTACHHKSSFPDIAGEYPDYLTCYTTISNVEQRTRYKAEFNAYFKEYQKLHVQIVKLSKQFIQLQEELKDKSESGNIEGAEAKKRQILQEYAKTKNIKARFYYLHDKLGHIKKLVSEYDLHTNISSIVNNNTTVPSNDVPLTV